jgi:ferredoxin-type protein NapG
VEAWLVGAVAVAMTRREFLRYSIEAGIMVTLAGACLTVSSEANYVRPPGAIPEDVFFRRCLKCGICVEICPTGCLDFVGLTTDIKNIGTSILNIRHGGCIAWKKDCLKCAAECPSGALKKPSDLAEVRLGSAFVRGAECTNCLMCFRECPVPGAVLFPNPAGEAFRKAQEIPVALYHKDSLLKPFVDNSQCVGCGLCAHVCPPRCIDVTPERERRMMP